MRRVLVALAAISLVGVAFIVEASQAKRPSHASTSAAKTITVQFHTTSFGATRAGKVLKRLPSNFRAGDSIFLTARLSQHGKKIGRQDRYCAVTALNKGVCTSVDTLPGGTIILSGASGGSFLVDAITGGTGRYADARGTATTTFKTSNDAVVVFKIAR